MTALVGWAVTTMRLAVTVRGSLTMLLNPGRVALNVYPTPTLSMCRSSKVAIPFTAFTVNVPVSDADEGLLAKSIFTLPLKLVSTAPFEPRASQTMVKAPPAFTDVGGSVLMANCRAMTPVVLEFPLLPPVKPGRPPVPAPPWSPSSPAAPSVP